jgi:ribosome-associated protein
VIEAAFTGAAEKLAIDAVLLCVFELIDAYDALFLATGRSDRQVRAIAEEIQRAVIAATGQHPLRAEGWEDSQWIALDYGSVIVHVFDEATRAYYDLEHLWNAAPAHRRTSI